MCLLVQQGLNLQQHIVLVDLVLHSIGDPLLKSRRELQEGRRCVRIPSSSRNILIIPPLKQVGKRLEESMLLLRGLVDGLDDLSFLHDILVHLVMEGLVQLDDRLCEPTAEVSLLQLLVSFCEARSTGLCRSLHSGARRVCLHQRLVFGAVVILFAVLGSSLLQDLQQLQCVSANCLAQMNLLVAMSKLLIALCCFGLDQRRCGIRQDSHVHIHELGSEIHVSQEERAQEAHRVCDGLMRPICLLLLRQGGSFHASLGHEVRQDPEEALCRNILVGSATCS
mmetsp:Transcript_97948/g.204314  ORF Transcript_97948/g.204314 Transcript_97948/m.204314 type:complete len:281 (-) Transcript_97948:437-1279(-)